MKKSFKKRAAALLTAAMVSSTGFSALAEVGPMAGPTVPTTAAAATVAGSSAAQTTTATVNATQTTTQAGAQTQTADAEATAQTTANGLPLQEDQRVLDFYQDSVIIGDSVADGFKLFAQGNKTNPLMGELQFLTASRYNLINALIPEEQDKTVAHPIYKGQFLNVWNSIKLMNAKHIYMFFGFNDLGDRTDKIVNRYVQLIHQIQAVNPDVDFTIISTTYIYPGYTKSFPGVKSWAFDNPTVRKLNTEMQKLAQQNGWGYMNIADALSDSQGNLNPNFCTDKMIHQNADAYVVWAQCFRDYAASRNFTHGTAADTAATVQ